MWTLRMPANLQVPRTIIMFLPTAWPDPPLLRSLSIYRSPKGPIKGFWDAFIGMAQLIVKDSVRTEQSILINALLHFVEPQLCEGRLTLSTGVPVTMADVASSATVYFTPHIGSRIALYVENYGWRNYQFAEINMDISGVGARTNLDILSMIMPVRSPSTWRNGAITLCGLLLWCARTEFWLNRGTCISVFGHLQDL